MTASIFIIGAGAVGGSLAVSLKRHGVNLVGICDIIAERALEIAEVTGTTAYFEWLPIGVTNADITIVAVPDHSIEKVAQTAVDRGVHSEYQIWLHVSGSLPAKALSPLDGKVRGLGSFHPALAFPPGRITEIPPLARFAVDGDDAALDAADYLARELNGYVVVLPEFTRPIYHAATVMASNYAVALLAEARQILVSAGLKEKDSEMLLTSLALSAIDAARKTGIDSALTGPIRRGDVKTVSKHIEELSAYNVQQELYRILGKATVRLTDRIGETDSDSLDAIEDLLE